MQSVFVCSAVLCKEQNDCIYLSCLQNVCSELHRWSYHETLQSIQNSCSFVCYTALNKWFADRLYGGCIRTKPERHIFIISRCKKNGLRTGRGAGGEQQMPLLNRCITTAALEALFGVSSPYFQFYLSKIPSFLAVYKASFIFKQYWTIHFFITILCLWFRTLNIRWHRKYKSIEIKQQRSLEKVPLFRWKSIPQWLCKTKSFTGIDDHKRTYHWCNCREAH